jgi:hypothetical protein
VHEVVLERKMLTRVTGAFIRVSANLKISFDYSSYEFKSSSFFLQARFVIGEIEGKI